MNSSPSQPSFRQQGLRLKKMFALSFWLFPAMNRRLSSNTSIPQTLRVPQNFKSSDRKEGRMIWAGRVSKNAMMKQSWGGSGFLIEKNESSINHTPSRKSCVSLTMYYSPVPAPASMVVSFTLRTPTPLIPSSAAELWIWSLSSAAAMLPMSLERLRYSFFALIRKTTMRTVFIILLFNPEKYFSFQPLTSCFSWGSRLGHSVARLLVLQSHKSLEVSMLWCSGF